MTDANVTLVVKRAPDGTHFVPFDHDDHPDRPAILRQMIAHLVQTGHHVEHRPGCPSHSGKAACPLGTHVVLHSGPMAPGGA